MKAARQLRSLENLQKALDFIEKDKGINLGGLIGPRDIYESNDTMILGLIWTLILRLAITPGLDEGQKKQKGKAKGVKKALLKWCQDTTEGYFKGGSAIKNFSGSFKSGLPFVAIIHRFRPDLTEFDKSASSREACEAAFSAAESLGIGRILDVEDICDTAKPDEKIVMTYVMECFNKLGTAPAKTDSEFRTRE